PDHSLPHCRELGHELIGLCALLDGERDRGTDGVRRRLRLTIRRACERDRTLTVVIGPGGISTREPDPCTQREGLGIGVVAAATFRHPDQLVRYGNGVVPVAVEVVPFSSLGTDEAQQAGQPVPLAVLGPRTEHAPGVLEPAVALETGREIVVTDPDHVEVRGGLCDRYAFADLVEASCITEAPVCGPDDDVETSTLNVHPECLDQRQGLGADTDRLLVSSLQHDEAA